MGYMRLEKFHNIWILGDSFPLGGSMPPFYIPQKTAFGDNELIVMKIKTEII